MTDERNPSDDVLDAIAGFQHRNESLHRHHDLDKPTCAYCTLAAKNALKALSAAGYVVVRAPGLNHGDELVRVDGMRVRGTQDNPKFTPTDSWVRRPVPEPATKPCDTCGGSGTADWGLGTCSACGGSGVATTEGSERRSRGACRSGGGQP